MKEYKDTYKTIEKPSIEILFKDRKSKFYGSAYPIQQASEVKDLIDELRKKHPAANHVCYAWQLGHDAPTYRVNDDGEPNNSAGMPILGQIKGFGLSNVLIAVVRIFGGTKLGVGGLINAYKTTAKMALETSSIIEKTLKIEYSLEFPYSEMDKVMRVVKKHQFQIVSQEMDLKCSIHILIRKGDTEVINTLFRPFNNIQVRVKK